VLLDGVEHAPRGPFRLRLESSGGLVLPELGAAPPEPEVLVEPHAFVGLECDTDASPGPLRVAELVLDGQLVPPGPARCDANVRLYDVTEPAAPLLVAAERYRTSPRNDRSFFAPDWKLAPGRVYRVVCRVSERRASRIVPHTGLALENRGALAGTAAGPCDDGAAFTATLDPASAYLELRVRVTELSPAGRKR